jgi:hypothetical protein
MAVENLATTDTSETALERRDMLLKDIDPGIVRRAWFTLSHLLLEEGAKVVDMGCFDGSLTYAMAAMNPKIRFIGVDKSKRQISKARETFQLHNLEYKIGDAVTEIFEPESLDAIINSYILHEIYSASRYNERIVSDTLRRQFTMLKKDGVMFVEDYASPPAGDYVLIELPDAPSAGDDLLTMSEADLLVWYSQYARPRQDPGCSGFFLEELPARVPRTRLFRLPHKWAYEFLLRKDNRTHWETALPVEYTFFTTREFRRELRNVGARVQYSGPYWDDELIEQGALKNIKLYDDSGKLLGPPPTCFIAVTSKMAERKSLGIEERRPSETQESKLKITAVRDQKSGRLTDIVSRDLDMSEIIPYRVDEENQLKIYLHEGVIKSLTNAVPRRGINLEEREWSGHMIEPVALPTSVMAELGEPDVKSTALFSRNYLGLRPQDGAILEMGPEYYPSPDYIDERVTTFYMKTEQSKTGVTPRNIIGHDERYQAKGILREFDAQQVLNAISVGMIPNARLELQILSLFNRLNIQAESWIDKRLNLHKNSVTASRALGKALKLSGAEGKRFKDVKGTAGQLRNVHSTFVEEGQARGAITGLTAQDVDFVIFDDRTINTAVVLPLTSDMGKEVHAAFSLEQMPVPERRDGNGMTASAITFNIPPEITNMKQAKKFIADKFGALPEMVIKMGEAYYSHIGVTPQKIYPFAVALPGKFDRTQGRAMMPLYQMMLMWQALSRDHKFNVNSKRPKMVWDTNMMVMISRCYRLLHNQFKFDAKLQVQAIVKERMAMRTPDWSIPVSYRQSPISQSMQTQGPEPSLVSTGIGQKWDKVENTEFAQAEASSSPASVKAAAAPAPINPATLPNLISDFEREYQEILDDLAIDDTKDLKLEKW